MWSVVHHPTAESNEGVLEQPVYVPSVEYETKEDGSKQLPKRPGEHNNWQGLPAAVLYLPTSQLWQTLDDVIYFCCGQRAQPVEAMAEAYDPEAHVVQGDMP